MTQGGEVRLTRFSGLTVSTRFFPDDLIEMILWDLVIGGCRWKPCRRSRGFVCCSITWRRSEDSRQSWKVAYSLREVLLLVVCGTIASGDGYDDIADWGEAHLSPASRSC